VVRTYLRGGGDAPFRDAAEHAVSAVRVRAVLFDVGGPLNTEVAHERLVDENIRAALAAEGRAVDDAEYARAVRRAVDSFAPNAYRAIIWYLTGGDQAASERVYRAAAERWRGRYTFELRDGIPELLDDLHRRGLRLGLAANQPQRTVELLDKVGIGRYFHHREVSGTHGFQKPDVRLFLRACDDLGVSPSECIMVGDRVDNDIAPALALGMRTVLFRTGRHIAQRPRSWDEIPDAEVRDTSELEAAIRGLLDGR
jgi:putative hydrolase of the HAD superfamily